MKTCLCIVPALAVIVFINSHRSSLFGTAKYQLVAERLLAGQTYYGDIDFDERAFQKLMAQRLPQNIETLVVGSSRTMQLQANCFHTSFYNASVSGAMISDVAAIVEQFRQGRNIRHVVLAADPWMLNAKAQSDAWNPAPKVANLIRIQAAPDWIRAQRHLGLTPKLDDFIAAARAVAEPYRELLAPTTLHAAFVDPFPLPSPVRLQNLQFFWGFRKVPNGSVNYPMWGPPDRDAVIRTAEEHLTELYAGFDRIDPFLARAFEALTSQLRNDGVQVTLVLAPFHPLYYHRAGPILRMTEAYFRNLQLETRGTYEPREIDMGESEKRNDRPTPNEPNFIDAVHVEKPWLLALYGCPPVIE